ncbi:MAG: CDP-glycerol glycerophosphotransferase family protein [Oscillospiraceae bacterium]|nr:CDP-glycerol glycerophosphotransferase family protein [Candidatus Equicaccousia limihippi]
MKRLFRIGVFFLKLWTAYIIAFFLKIFNHKYRNLWIISERGDDARDNGYFFFKYIREKHSEINIWFVIDPASADFEKVNSLGKWVKHNSFWHFVVYATAIIRLSSSTWGGDLPYAAYFQNITHKVNPRKPFVWLKHGVDKEYAPAEMATCFYPSLLICGAYPEYIYSKNTYKHKDGVIQYTGLSRFDNLHGELKTKNQILVMPTFRKWLSVKDKSIVENSEFCERYNKLLHDQRLYELLRQNDLDLIFYPHYVMQPFADCFTTDCERIKIAKFKDYDVQQLLIESKLLVTDFSSVFFDFGYMNKPSVYYHFDRERYINEHYDFTKGYFSYDDDGFGEVAFEHDTLVDLIEQYIKRDFTLSDEYSARISKFFPLQDTRNSERIYEKIMDLLKK